MNSRWIVPIQSSPHARLRLFCFPYAGGSASIYRTWGGQMPPDVEVIAIQMPGREGRLRELPVKRMSQLVRLVSHELLPYLDKPFAVWGHSMGALIGFELARQLRSIGKPQPRHLFVSAHRAPQLPQKDSSIHNLPDGPFIDELRRLEGTPEAILQNDELMSLLLPALRADFELVETYIYRNDVPLDCPISAIGGSEDIEVSETDLAEWRSQTRGQFALHTFPSGHFFLHSDQDLLLQVVRETLQHGSWI